MHSKTWVWVGLGVVLILAVANLAILAAFPPEQRHVQEQLRRVDWILPFGPGFEHPDPCESPVVVYDGTNKTWQLQSATAWNQTLSLGERYNLDPAHPEDIRYTPDIAIEGGTVSLNFFIRNLAGEDCARADLAVTTGIERLNATTGSLEGDILPGAATTLPIEDLAAGEWCEVRVTADLPQPDPEEILYLTIGLTAPYTFTTPNGTPADFRGTGSGVSDPFPTKRGTNYPGYNQPPLPRASATFVVAGKDAPESVLLPTLRAV